MHARCHGRSTRRSFSRALAAVVSRPRRRVSAASNPLRRLAARHVGTVGVAAPVVEKVALLSFRGEAAADSRGGAPGDGAPGGGSASTDDSRATRRVASARAPGRCRTGFCECAGCTWLAGRRASFALSLAPSCQERPRTFAPRAGGTAGTLGRATRDRRRRRSGLRPRIESAHCRALLAVAARGLARGDLGRGALALLSKARISFACRRTPKISASRCWSRLRSARRH